jgi:hypothetical protein
MRITIPVGATATVYVPAVNPGVVHESGHLAATASGVTFLRTEPGVAVYSVKSGTYAFSSVDSPSRPGTLHAVASNGVATLSWNTVANGASYTVHRSTAGSEPVIVAQNLIAAHCTDTGLTDGVTYHYTVTASNASGEGPGAVTEVTPTIIADGGFESPEVSHYAYAPVGNAWTFTPLSGTDGSGISGNGSDFTRGNPSAAPEGKQVAFLQGKARIRQTLVGLIPGTSYLLTFSAAQRTLSNHGGETWQVLLDGTVVADYAPPQAATGYTDYSAVFVATASSQTLSFVGTNTRGQDNTVFLDNVRLRIGDRGKL